VIQGTYHTEQRGVELEAGLWELPFHGGAAITALGSIKLSNVEPLSASRRRAPLVVAVLVAVAALATLTLAKLPYSTSWISRAEPADVILAPGSVFRVGSLTWDVGSYSRDPSLEPFREAFGGACGTAVGLAAARCVTDLIKVRSPRGEPRVEFVDADFDPSAALKVHMNGAPGHCTTRSALTATALLALGVPARIVQVLPLEERGHNLVEVWDPTLGWLLFDPHFDSSYLLGDSFLSAVKLSEIQGGLRWRRPSEGQPDPNLFAGSTISYPEPWLYTRVGERCAPWPFRGCFVQVGPLQFRYGPAQHLAFFVAVASALGAVVFLSVRVLPRWRRRS
jgi:hypothetical protein